MLALFKSGINKSATAYFFLNQTNEIWKIINLRGLIFKDKTPKVINYNLRE